MAYSIVIHRIRPRLPEVQFDKQGSKPMTGCYHDYSKVTGLLEPSCILSQMKIQPISIEVLSWNNEFILSLATSLTYLSVILIDVKTMITFMSSQSSPTMTQGWIHLNSRCSSRSCVVLELAALGLTCMVLGVGGTTCALVASAFAANKSLVKRLFTDCWSGFCCRSFLCVVDKAGLYQVWPNYGPTFISNQLNLKKLCWSSVSHKIAVFNLFSMF